MEHVEARLAALELAVAELRDQLGRGQTRIRTMRHTFQCPSCGGGRILHFRRVNESGSAGILPLSLNTQYSVWWGAKEGDPLEAYVCRACGLLEWHATNLQALEPDGDNIVELVQSESARESEPYR